MKRISALFVAGLLCTAVLPLSAQDQKKDRGHWALQYSKVFVDGTRTNGENSGVRSAKSGSATFSILHYVAGSFTPDGSFTSSTKNGTTTVNVGGSRTAEQRNMHSVAITWSKPEQYIKVGEENTLSVGTKTMFDSQPYSDEVVKADYPSDKQMRMLMSKEKYSVNLTVLVSPAIKMRRFTLDYDSMKQFVEKADSFHELDRSLDRYEDERYEAQRALAGYGDMTWSDGASNAPEALLANNDAWSQSLPLDKDAYMMVIVQASAGTSRNIINPSSKDETFGTVTQVYLYRCFPDGGDVTNEIRPDDGTVWSDGGDDGGESESIPIPPWVIPVGVGLVVAGGVGKLVKGGKKNKKEPEEREEEPEEEEEKKKPSSYKMYLYKEFGNTLRVGEEPKMVGARIEEITAEGVRIDRRDLTAQIEITEGANIRIVERGMTKKYRCARIDVDKMPTGDSPEGHIFFTFRAPGGALHNKVIFNIENGTIEFFQGNLTLPAFYEKEAKLPFVVHGAGENVDVDVNIPSDRYTVDYEKGPVKGLWYAKIQEKLPENPLDRKPGPAGKYEVTRLDVKVTDVNKNVIEGSIPLMRFNMGLVFEADSLVGCFYEEYDPEKHFAANKIEQLQVAYGEKTYAPFHTRATMSLITWDEEAHQLRRVVPAGEQTKFSALPLPEDQDKETTDYYSKGTQGMSDSQILERVRPQLFVKEILEDGSSECYIFPCAPLDAPSRRKVKLHLEVSWNGEKYEAEQDVWLTSQPVRTFQTFEEEQKADKEDEQIADDLFRICQFIRGHELLNRIGPVYKLAQMQLDAYDWRFGFDPGLVYLVRTTYLRFIRGETLGANAEAEPVEEMGLAADIMLALAQTSTQAEAWLEEHGGIWTRLAIGVATLGWSETALLTVKVSKDMIDVVNNPKNPGGAWEAFCVGVYDVVIEYATEKLWSSALGGTAEVVAHYRPDIASNATRLMSTVTGKVQSKLGVLAKDVRVVAKDLKSYATDVIGKRMGASTKAAQNVRKTMTQAGEDIIRDFRKNAKWTPEEVLEDEIGRASNAGAVKDIKSFEHAYFEYRRYRTPEAEAAFREWCYKFQSNKTAQKQLALYKGDWANNLRSEYYRTLQGDYAAIDREALRSAAKKLREMGEDVSEEDLFVFCATNSDAAALASGTSLTRDRDLSMLYNTKKTKANPNPVPKEVPQNIAEECYGEAYKRRTGMTMAQGDQAVVQTGSKEMIGKGKEDLYRAFNKQYFDQTFEDLDGVATAFEHKPEAWIQKGAELRAMGDVAGALSNEEEGLRQAIKLYFNSIEPRGTYRGTLSMLSPSEKEMFYVLKHLEVKQQGPLSLSVPEVRKLFKERFHMGLEDIPAKMKEIVYRLES